jgi:aconitate hydratase
MLAKTDIAPPNTASVWQHAGEDRQIIDLPAVFGGALANLPYVMRILAENCLRHAVRADQAEIISRFTNWRSTTQSANEITFSPRRILMHDTTCGPALVDIAALRDQLVLAGKDPRSLNPVIPIDVSTDHSLSVEHYGRADAAAHNLAAEFAHNAERYRFMKWAGKTMDGLTIHPPGTGIMHTINLEQLATIISSVTADTMSWAIPDSLIGTDSHTPMINGIGVLGWGVGGIEAEAAMFGLPLTMRMPRVVGVHLKGALPSGLLASDVALTITHILRQHRLDNAFVEFFGHGVCALPVATRATIANMAPEFGGTTGYFPIDDMTISYLAKTGRTTAQQAFVKAYAQRVGLWFTPDNRPNFSDVIEIDLVAIKPSLAGPLRPQDRIDISGTCAAMTEATQHKTPPPADKPYFPIAIAAITSCTNTSDIGALVAAGLVAQKAVSRGLTVPAWVKTSLAPGSPAAADALRRVGLIAPLAALGFDIVGFGCTTCIGQSGPLAPDLRPLLDGNARYPVAVISGNRNFPGRIHPDVGHAFLGAPAHVIAFAIAGDAGCNLLSDPLGTGRDGRPVYLADIWPDDDEITATTMRANAPDDYAASFRAAQDNPVWNKLDTTASPTYRWDAASTFLRPPPFCQSVTPQSHINMTAAPLLVLSDDITTDHISPAGPILPNSDAGRYLIEQGEAADALGVYAARRGNWEVMRRGIFINPALVNLLDDTIMPGTGLFPPTGAIMPLWECAAAMQAAGLPAVVFAGERYGMGSSRDWAAKGQHLLGVRAVLATSFERIHRANLIGMGIIPLRLAAADHPTRLGLSVEDRVEISIDLTVLRPDEEITVSILRNGQVRNRMTVTVEIKTASEIAQIRAGGIMSLILAQFGSAA